MVHGVLTAQLRCSGQELCSWQGCSPGACSQDGLTLLAGGASRTTSPHGTHQALQAYPQLGSSSPPQCEPHSQRVPQICRCSPDAGQAVEVKVFLLSYSLCLSVLLGSHALPQQCWRRLGRLSHPAHRLSLRRNMGGRAPNRGSASDKSFPFCFLVPSPLSAFLSLFPVAILLDQFLQHQHFSFL